MLEIDEKISNYQKALDNVVKQLRDKRSELAELAKKTVSDLELSIPKLQGKVNELRAEEQKLNTSILEKQQQYRNEKNSFLVEFDNMSKLLQSQHDVKIRELAAVQKELDKIKQEFSSKAKTLDAKISELSASVASNHLEKDKHIAAVANLEIEKQRTSDEVAKIKAEVLKNKENVLILEESLKLRLDEVEKKSAILTERTGQAEGVIARLKEANATFKNAADKESANKKREEELNASVVKVMADISKNNKRSADLDLREAEAARRLENIKILESKLTKG